MRFLVNDCGLALEHALRLKRDGHEVKYFTPWNNNFPKFQDYAIGLGFLDKELYFFENIDWADCICFFDTGMGDLATFLRSKGYCVYGAGIKGEKLENHRYLSRWIQKAIGLPVQQTDRIEGVSDLKKFLGTHPDSVVKHDIFRGDLETFYAKDEKAVSQILDDLSKKVGPFKDSIEMLVEKGISGLEPGFDCFHNGRGWLAPYFYGYECKHAYIGKVADELPKPLDYCAKVLGKYLSGIDYRSAMSIEVRLSQGVPYLIDYTARMPFPLSLAYTELIENYSEVIYAIAKGADIKIKTRAPYFGCAPLNSEYAKENWLRVDFPREIRDSIKFQTAAEKEGVYALPPMSQVATLVAVGDSPADVAGKLKELSQKVSAHDLDANSALYSLEKIRESIAEGVKAGVDF